MLILTINLWLFLSSPHENGQLVNSKILKNANVPPPPPLYKYINNSLVCHCTQ